MDGLLAAAVRESARLEKQARVARRSLRALQDELGHRLGSYQLKAGERLDDREVLDFLHLAIGEREGKQEIRITVTAPRGADQGD